MKKWKKRCSVVMSLVMSMSLAGYANAAPVLDSTEEVFGAEMFAEGEDVGIGNLDNYENQVLEGQEGFFGDAMENRMPGGGGRGNGGGAVRENAPEIQEILDANADKFQQLIFEDTENGVALEYSLYVPEDYDPSEKYPLVMFIPDSSGSGKSARQLVEQYYGATVWVTEEEQQKHPSFVLVPAFSETVVDDNWNVSEQVETAVRLLMGLQAVYNIDADRIYTTGQSMGCMTSLYLNSVCPDLFAASMYVSGQWDVSVLKGMENQKFFYIVAGGDQKASGGQKEVMEMFDADGVAYSYGTWNAQNSEEEQSAAVEELLSLGLQGNMICFETGSVLNEGEGGMEHMSSFNYGYKLTAVRDWLFEQSK